MLLEKFVARSLRLIVVAICLSQFGYSQADGKPASWEKFDLPFASFSAPSDIEAEKVQGRDSAVWKFSNKSLVLMIDLGLYSGKSDSDKEEDCYVEKSTVINGRKASIVSYVFASHDDGDKFRYVSAAYFSRIGSEKMKLSFSVLSKTPNEKMVAERIFRSIRFK